MEISGRCGVAQRTASLGELRDGHALPRGSLKTRSSVAVSAT